MIDISRIRSNFEEVKRILSKRSPEWASVVQNIYELDQQYRDLLQKQEKNNAYINKASKDFVVLKKDNKTSELTKLQTSVQKIKNEQSVITTDLLKISEKLKLLTISIPNLPHSSVPVGKDENDNKEVLVWSKPTKFNFQPKAHWDLAVESNLVDFKRAVKLTGSRFTLYTDYGAKLIRALIQYTLDLNCEAGFIEMLPAVILNSKSLTNTGQLPKFEEDLFKLTNGYFLSPTAEVQLTNYFSDEILEEKDLPYRFTANTSCFRSEAGSASKDTKGVVRQHQFYKTEMVILSLPKDSYNQHEFMTNQAEQILKNLNLPYRKIVLCTGDMGFGATKTYDIEVWLPSYGAYKEISSCSNCEDFQARRMKLRFKDKDGKIEYCHTLNGSGLAIDRLWAAVVENYQQKDGGILIPQPLRKYMNNLEKIPYGTTFKK